ncbi:MAG: chemotaxis protein CheC [Pseudomonadota bacterium]
MNNNEQEVLTEEERDTLQEIMNIGFGSAAADISEVIDLYVVLSVPTISVLKTSDLLEHIKSEIKDHNNITIVEQNFFSKFKGLALLIFTLGAGKGLLSVLGKELDEEILESDPMGMLEEDLLLEVGNILIGACVGKIAELLGDVVNYSPPRIITGNLADRALSDDMSDPRNIVIILRTIFHFSSNSATGCLFLVTSHESVSWLKQALQTFLSQYE